MRVLILLVFPHVMHEHETVPVSPFIVSASRSPSILEFYEEHHTDGINLLLVHFLKLWVFFLNVPLLNVLYFPRSFLWTSSSMAPRCPLSWSERVALRPPMCLEAREWIVPPSSSIFLETERSQAWGERGTQGRVAKSSVHGALTP